MKKILSMVMSLVLVFALSITALAAVTLDTATGVGFVGKGDVQTALGLNNKQMQLMAEKLVFTYVTEARYNVVVTWTTGEGTKGETIHEVTHKKVATVNNTVDYTSRERNQYTGFILDGFEEVSNIGTIPAEGSEFPGNSGHTVKSVELVEGSVTGGLYVNGVLLQ